MARSKQLLWYRWGALSEPVLSFRISDKKLAKAWKMPQDSSPTKSLAQKLCTISEKYCVQDLRNKLLGLHFFKMQFWRELLNISENTLLENTLFGQVVWSMVSCKFGHQVALLHWFKIWSRWHYHIVHHQLKCWVGIFISQLSLQRVCLFVTDSYAYFISSNSITTTFASWCYRPIAMGYKWQSKCDLLRLSCASREQDIVNCAHSAF